MTKTRVSLPGLERRGLYRGQVTITSGGALTPPADAPARAEDANPQSGAVGAPTTETGDGGISVAVAPSPTEVSSVSVAATETTVPPPRPGVTTPGSPEVDSSRSSMPAPPVTGTAPESRYATTKARLRAALPPTGPGLTGPRGAVLGTLMVGLGALLDVALGNELGLGFTATFLLGCVLVALALRVRALATAVVLPPLLFAAAAFFETRQSGVTSGNRQAAIDVATTLALSAPVLFTGTALALAVVLGRLVVHAVRR